MTAIGGGLSASSGLVVGSAGLSRVDPTMKPQTAEISPVVRRLRAASFDAQWHDLLDGVYLSCFASVES